MAQSGFTPISLYYSSTASSVPLAGNLANGELALNTADMKLYAKNSGGTVTLLAANSSTGATVSSVGQTFTGGLIAVSGSPVTSAGTLALTVAGTSGGVPYFSSASTWASSAALAANALVIGGGAGAAPSTITTGSGVVTALGNATNATNGFATTNGSATLTNKRIDPRVSTAASAASITPDVSAFDMYALTAQAVGLTVNAPVGTPVDGSSLIIRILDNGVAQTLSWNGTFTPVGFVLPTITVASKIMYVGCLYNAANTRWDAVAFAIQA